MPEPNRLKVVETELGPVEYIQRDRSDGPDQVIVTLHGAMGGYDQSDILGRTIGPEGYRYIALSRPGYLRTPLKGRETPEKQADLIAALLDVLKVRRAVVFAISGGGYSALHFALRHPGRCKALVLCSTTGGINDTPIPFGFSVMKLLARMRFFTDIIRRKTQEDIEGALNKSVSFPDILSRTTKDKEAMALFKELSVGMTDDMSQRIPGTVNDINVTRRHEYALHNIKVPSLIVHGTDDPHVPFDAHGRRLADEIPGAFLHTIPRGEHAAIFTHRREVKTAVAEFLKGLPPGYTG